MRYLLTLFLLVGSLSAYSQTTTHWIHAVLYKTDGSEQKVDVKTPFGQGKMKIRDARGSVRKITGEGIREMHLLYPKDSVIVFTNLKVEAYKVDMVEKRSSKRSTWLLTQKETPVITHLIGAGAYSIDTEKQGLMLVYQSGQVSGIMHYFQRPGEERPTLIYSGLKMGKDYYQRAQAAYFADDPGLQKRILRGSYAKGDYYRLIDDYSERH